VQVNQARAEQRQHSDLAIPVGGLYFPAYRVRSDCLAPQRKKKRTWRVIRLPATFIGLVEAPDEPTALKVAIEQFKISPGDQWRLVVRPC
jgi:hypothetical protein